MQLSVYFEKRDDIWEKDARTIFPLMGVDGKLNGKALFFLKEPAPESEADGIEIDLNNHCTIEDIDKLIERKYLCL